MKQRPDIWQWQGAVHFLEVSGKWRTEGGGENGEEGSGVSKWRQLSEVLVEKVSGDLKKGVKGELFVFEYERSVPVSMLIGRGRK